MHFLVYFFFMLFLVYSCFLPLFIALHLVALLIHVFHVTFEGIQVSGFRFRPSSLLKLGCRNTLLTDVPASSVKPFKPFTSPYSTIGQIKRVLPQADSALC